MKKIIFLLTFAIFLTSFASAEIIMTQPVKETYNLGDSFLIPITIKASLDVSGSFQMNLLCNGHEINFYKNDVKLAYGEEIKMEPLLVLTKDKGIGTCKIKALLTGEESQLTKEFQISNLLSISPKIEKTTLNPGDTLKITGDAIKTNSEDVNGFIDLEISINGSTIISQSNTIKKGFFSIDVSLPKDMKSGLYILKLQGYEKDLNNEITNKGFATKNIKINQIPTSLEITFENKEIEPGTNLKVKTILHDQTGEKIKSNSIITIKDENNKILEQTEKQTNEFLEFPISYNEAPGEWKIVAISNKLSSESTFNITEKQDIEIKLINKTIIISNIGNVKYCNKSISVKIGEEIKNIPVCLDIDETQKYVLTAPDGEYQIEILSEGEEKVTGNVFLTGKVIEVNEAGKGIKTLMKHPLVWIFIILVLGFTSFFVIKRTHKKNFFAYFKSKKEKKEKEILNKDSLIKTKNRAIISLSIKGDKQNTSIVGLKIKNFKEIESKKENIKETLQKIVSIAEELQASVYENKENLFFILAPVKTRSFKNEKKAIEIAQRIQKLLREHNKLFKQKIEFGISLNYGPIIAKQEKNVLQFMSLGGSINKTKKISSLSNEEIFLSKEIKDRLIVDVKTEKHKKVLKFFYQKNGRK